MVPRESELVEQLIRLMEVRLLDPLEILLSDDAASDTMTSLRMAARHRAQAWVQRIIDGDDREAVMAITRVISALYPGDVPFDPPVEWWRTPLGRAVAWRVGHPGAVTVSYAVAGAMLGITRQGVHDLVNRGKLTRHPDGGVDPRSVRDRLRQLERSS